MAYYNKIIIILFCAILIFLFFPITAVKAVSGTDFYNLTPSTISNEIKNAICKLEPFYSKTDGKFTYDFIVNMQQYNGQYSIIFILRDTVNNFENKMPLVNYAEENYDYGMFGKLDTAVATDGLTAGSSGSYPSDSTSNY